MKEIKHKLKIGLYIFLLCLIIIGVAYAFALAFCEIRRQTDAWAINRIPIVEDKVFNGTLGMVKYNYGFFGSVDSTDLFFHEGLNFTFGGELQVVVGHRYEVKYQLSTYPNNSTKINAVSIMEID